MADILKNDALNDRDFGDDLLSVSELLKWAEEKNYLKALPDNPSLQDFDFVQIELLLNNIMGAIQDRTSYEQAEKRIGKLTLEEKKNLHPLKLGKHTEHTKAFPRWAVAANSHVIWRNRITDAISSGHITKYDGATLDPIPEAPVGTQTDDKKTPSAGRISTNAKSIRESNNDSGSWIIKIQQEAARMWTALRQSGANPTKLNIIDDLAKWARNTGITSRSGIYPSSSYIYRHVLRKWTPPN